MITQSLIVLAAIIVVVVIFLVWEEIRVVLLKRKLGEAVVGTEKRNIQLSYLIKTAKSLSSALNKEKLLRVIIETYGDLTKSDRTASLCALYLMDYNVSRFVYTTGYNMDVTMLSRPSFSIDDQPFKLLKKQNEIIFFDEKEDIKHSFFKENKLHMLQEVDNTLLIPLIVENETMGVVTAFLSKPTYDFFRKDPYLLRALTGQVCIALGSAVQSELAVLDRLTKVYNHVYFEGRLQQEIARSDRYKYPVSVLMIDIDHFKRINDTHGHPQGDVILQEVAKVIKSNIRIVDLCARYGGEEFAVILPETDLTAYSERTDVKKSDDEAGGALAKAQSLRKAVEKMEVTTPEGARMKLTVSIGIGVKRFPEGARMTKDQLIKEADRQLYKAKQEGRNRVCHAQKTSSPM
jgi:diguanylate cyclase (GGDEF)-like protein